MADFYSLDEEQSLLAGKGVSVVEENVLNVRTQIAFDVAFDRRVRKP